MGSLVAACKILQKETVTNQRESFWQQPGINSSSLEKKTLEKRFLIWEMFISLWWFQVHKARLVINYRISVLLCSFLGCCACCLIKSVFMRGIVLYFLHRETRWIGTDFHPQRLRDKAGWLVASYTPSFVCNLSHFFSSSCPFSSSSS